MTTLYHTSPYIIEAPLKWGSDLFGDHIFFSSEVYVMTAKKDFVVYELDKEICSIADKHELLDLASDDFLSEYENSECLWEKQRLLGDLATENNFDGVADRDEQGAVFIMNIKKIFNKIRLV